MTTKKRKGSRIVNFRDLIPSNQACMVRIGRGLIIGMLYFQTPQHVVLINGLNSRADLGHLRPLRREHVDSESSVTVIPQAMVDSIEYLKKQ